MNPVAIPERRGLFERPLDYWYDLEGDRERGLVSGESAGRWDATDSDGLIAIPYSFHASYSENLKARVRKYMDEVNKDQKTKSSSKINCSRKYLVKFNKVFYL